MEKILEAGFMKDMIKATNDMWLKGWDERNGGNASYRLSAAEAREFVPVEEAGPWHELKISVPELAGESFLVTGSGRYFRNVILDPPGNLGIITIGPEGKSFRHVWGFAGGGVPTSELAAHLLSHAARIAASGGTSRVVIHTHATNLIALTYRYPNETAVFTRILWEMSTECLVVFPDGIGVLPWMVPGTDEIGEATARLMKTHRLVLWPYHGVFGCGASLDEAFGLIDTAEKAAEILVKVDSMGGKKYSMTDENLVALAARFKVTPLSGLLTKSSVK